jgi:heptose-I-phosphate ethanolaminephosphotransferase
MYFSDHGEEVFDLKRFYGRDVDNLTKYMFDVPLMVWFSDGYKKIRDTNPLRGYLDRPYQLDGLIHTILDMAHIKTDMADESKSIVSGGYEVQARLVRGNETLMPYLWIEPTSMYNTGTIEEEKNALDALLD